MSPSSKIVTSSLATRSPTRPLYNDVPLRLKSASSPCPTASCSSTPPPPAPMTTGNSPAGASRAPSLVVAMRADSRRERFRGRHVEHADARAAAVPDVAVLALRALARDDLHAERNQRPPIGHHPPVARCDLHVLQLVGNERVHGHDPRIEGARRAVGARQQIDVARGIGRLAGVCVVEHRRSRGAQLHDDASFAPVPRDQRGRVRRAQQRRLVEVLGVRVPGALSGDDAHAGTANDARRRFVNARVLQPKRLREPVLEEHVGEVAAPPQRSSQHASKHHRIEGGQHDIVPSMRNGPIMPAARSAVAGAIALPAVLAAYLTAVASCPPATGRDAAACDAAHQAGVTAALCASAARRIETCADHATGRSEIAIWRAPPRNGVRRRSPSIARSAQARRWLAHATVLDERVQDDPGAPAALRAQAKRNEELARAELLRGASCAPECRARDRCRSPRARRRRAGR